MPERTPRHRAHTIASNLIQLIMQKMQTVLYNTLRRIQDFLDLHNDIFSTINQSDARKELDALVIKIGDQGQSEASAKMIAKSETGNLKNLRVDLRKNHMDPVAKIAKSKLRNTPQFTALTLPKGNLSDVKLAQYANAMADAAQPYSATFIAQGQPADFIAQMRSAAAAILTS